MLAKATNNIKAEIRKLKAQHAKHESPSYTKVWELYKTDKDIKSLIDAPQQAPNEQQKLLHELGRKTIRSLD